MSATGAAESPQRTQRKTSWPPLRALRFADRRRVSVLSTTVKPVRGDAGGARGERPAVQGERGAGRTWRGKLAVIREDDGDVDHRGLFRRASIAQVDVLATRSAVYVRGLARKVGLELWHGAKPSNQAARQRVARP